MDSVNDEIIDSVSMVDSDNELNELLTMNLEKNQPILLILNNKLVKNNRIRNYNYRGVSRECLDFFFLSAIRFISNNIIMN